MQPAASPPRVRIMQLGIPLAAIVVALILARLLNAPPAVEIAIVDRGIVEDFVSAPAMAYVRDRYTVSAPVAGEVSGLAVQAEHAVRSGEPLLELITDAAAIAAIETHLPQARNAVEEAQANAEAARVRLEQSRREYIRLGELHARGRAARQELDAAEYALKDAQAQLRSAEFRIDVTRHRLGALNGWLEAPGKAEETGEDIALPLRSAVRGTVLAVHSGNTARTEAGEVLLEIGDMESLEARADVPPQLAARLEPGMPVSLSRRQENRPLDGRVRQILPVGGHPDDARNEQDALVIIEWLSPRERWQHLDDGTRMDARFLAWQGHDVLRVPVDALYRQEDRWMVMRVQDKRAYGTPVTVGHRGDTHVEIRDGLQAGDHVLLHPGELADGARVRER